MEYVMAVSITYSDEFLTTTAKNRLKKERQSQYRRYRVAQWFIDNAKRADGGERLLIPFDVQAHSNTTQLVTGYEPIDMDVQPVLSPGHQAWAYSVSPVAFSFVDQSKNTGKHKVIDLIEQRVKDTEMRMLKEFETQLLKATQANWSDWVSLNGTDTTDGILEGDVAYGSQTNTVHNINKTTYQAFPGMQNQQVSMTNDFSANGIQKLHDLHVRIREVCDDPMKLAGFCSIDGGINYLTAVQANERYMNGNRDAIGTKIVIDGLPYEMSSLMPDDGSTTSANNNKWSFMVLDANAICFHALPNLLGNMTEFRDLGGGHLVKACFLQYGGQIAVSYWGSNGVAEGGETY